MELEQRINMSSSQQTVNNGGDQSEGPSAAPLMPPPTTSTSSTVKSSQPPSQPKATGTASTDIQGTTCMELALEGERLCKLGDLKAGVRFFEEALKVGTANDRTLSAIYSQLGNAYFYLEDYQKALDYHKQDVILVHSIGDEAAEAKACGNLGNTFKMLGKFDEAAVYCRRYLEISRKLQDKVGEARALYNLGNVYHMQGKRMIGTSEQETGELPSDIESSLQRAIEYYEANLRVVTELNDYVAMGRAHGNLGNTHYLLGNFQSAVDSHEKRLELAKQTHDKSAERRAYLNLGNANVFLGNFSEAIKNYTSTLKLAQELNDKHTEAQACQSLANTYTFLRDYKSAIEYHTIYFDLIKDFDDKLGEGRACWSLVNIYHIIKDPESALVYAKKHCEIAKQLGDETGLACAKANIEELEDTIAQKQAFQTSTGNVANSTAASSRHDAAHGPTNNSTSSVNSSKRVGTSNYVRLSSDKRQEQEQRRFKKQLNSNLAADIDGLAAARRRGKGGMVRSSSSERLFDMIAHFQSGRIDDQRCEILKRPIPIVSDDATSTKSHGLDDKENMTSNNTIETTPAINGSSSSSSSSSNNNNNNNASSGPKLSQPSMTNPMSAVSAAASAIKATYRKASLAAYPTALSQSIQSQRRPTVSAEHREQLFDLIAGAQGQRMDEQRASLPALTLTNGVLKNPMNAGLLNRGQTIDQSGSKSSKPDTIYEDSSRRSKERSQSIAPSHINFNSSLANNYSPMPTVTAPNLSKQLAETTSKPKFHKLSRQFQTIDSEAPAHDEKFLDSLMKYQSTRFDDQRSEFPNKNLDTNKTSENRQVDNFFNLIVKFQSDRIDDQRSAPPPRSKNI